MSARDEILARVRAALAGSPPAPAAPRGYRREGTRDRAELVGLLADRLADYRAGVHRAAPAGRSAAVAQVLTGTTTLVVPADLPEQWLSAYPGAVRRDAVVRRDAEVRRDAAPDPLAVPELAVAELDAPGVSVLTGCAVAIAETGTIVLDAGFAQGRRALTLVPDHHVCVVHVDQIVASVPEGLSRLADPTRPLTFISGPSATSDIELDRVEGVHGPRRLDVIII